MIMNNSQRRVCVLFAAFLLITGILLLFAEKSLSAIIAIALSAAGFFLFFSGKPEKEKSKVRLIETKAFKVVASIFKTIVTLALMIGVFLWLKGGIKGYYQGLLEKAEINLQANVEREEKENAKQVEYKAGSINEQVAPMDSQINISLKNNSFDVAERIDLLVKYYTLNNYFISDDYINDITNGNILTPKSQHDFTKNIIINPPKEPHKTMVSVDKVKFRDCWYSVIKCKLSLEDYPGKYIEDETIHKFDTLGECQEYIASQKNKSDNIIVSTECVKKDDRISKVFSNKPISCWYIRTTVESKAGIIVEYVGILPYLGTMVINAEDSTRDITEGSIETFKKNGCRANIYGVSPEGKVTTYLNTLE